MPDCTGPPYRLRLHIMPLIEDERVTPRDMSFQARAVATINGSTEFISMQHHTDDHSCRTASGWQGGLVSRLFTAVLWSYSSTCT